LSGVEASNDAVRQAAAIVDSGDVDGGIRLLKAALKDRPDSFPAHLLLARCYLRKSSSGMSGFLLLARKEYDAARGLIPADREAHLESVRMAPPLGRVAEARAEYAGRFQGLPFAGECLAELDAAEGKRSGRKRKRLVAILVVAALVAVAYAGGLLLDYVKYGRLAKRPPLSLSHGMNMVMHVEFAPDGTLASSGFGGVIRLWTMGRQNPAADLLGHTGTVSSVSFSNDGGFLASAGWDKTVRIWAVPSGAVAAERTGIEAGAKLVAFAPDGKAVAVALWNDAVVVWDTNGLKDISRVSESVLGINALRYSPDGTALAGAGQDRTIRFWEPSTGRLVRKLEGGEYGTAEFMSLAFSPDGRLLAAGNSVGAVCIMDANTGEVARIIRAHRDMIHGLAFSPDGKLLAVAGDTGKVTLHRVSSGRLLATFATNCHAVFSVAFSPDGKRMAAAVACGYALVWDL
jgi:hypothetical protein